MLDWVYDSFLMSMSPPDEADAFTAVVLPPTEMSPDDETLAVRVEALICSISMSPDDEACRVVVLAVRLSMEISPDEEECASQVDNFAFLISISPDDEACIFMFSARTVVTFISPDDDALATMAGAVTWIRFISPDELADRLTVLFRNSNRVEDVSLPLDEACMELTSGPLTLMVTPFMW